MDNKLKATTKRTHHFQRSKEAKYMHWASRRGSNERMVIVDKNFGVFKHVVVHERYRRENEWRSERFESALTLMNLFRSIFSETCCRNLDLRRPLQMHEGKQAFPARGTLAIVVRLRLVFQSVVCRCVD